MVQPSSVRCRSQCSKIFFSETALPIKAKFYVKPPWVGGTIFCSRHLGHMNKMAAIPIYDKNPSKIFFSRTGDFHETWYVASGTPAHHFSETIAASDLKVCSPRSRHLIEYIKICEY